MLLVLERIQESYILKDFHSMSFFFRKEQKIVRVHMDGFGKKIEFITSLLIAAGHNIVHHHSIFYGKIALGEMNI